MTLASKAALDAAAQMLEEKHPKRWHGRIEIIVFEGEAREVRPVEVERGVVLQRECKSG